MSVEMMHEIVVESVLNDPYDGTIRLLGDAQRFGYQLQALALTTMADGATSANLILLVPNSADAQLVATRLARHPAVQWVDAKRTVVQSHCDCSQMVAA